MSGFQRFAIFYLPESAALAQFGAAWLGWDVARGTPVPHPGAGDLDLEAITETPRRYGFHATLKAPFRLAPGATRADLLAAAAALAARQPPVAIEGLTVAALGRFAALVPTGDSVALAALAARCVTDLDTLRAPPDEAELTRRRAAGLTAAQEANLTAWGYPHVLDEFRFHLTLSGPLDAAQLAHVTQVAEALLPPLPRPCRIGEIAVVGERMDGRFEAISRYPLAG